MLVESLEDLFDAAAVLGRLMLPAADRLAELSAAAGADVHERGAAGQDGHRPAAGDDAVHHLLQLRHHPSLPQPAKN